MDSPCSTYHSCPMCGSIVMMRFLSFFNHDKSFRASCLAMFQSSFQKNFCTQFYEDGTLESRCWYFTLIRLARIEGDTEASGAPGWPRSVPWGHLDSGSEWKTPLNHQQL